MNHLILQHPNYVKKFILMTGSLGVDLDVVLAQKNNNDNEVVIVYVSRTLNLME